MLGFRQSVRQSGATKRGTKFRNHPPQVDVQCKVEGYEAADFRQMTLSHWPETEVGSLDFTIWSGWPSLMHSVTSPALAPGSRCSSINRPPAATSSMAPC